MNVPSLAPIPPGALDLSGEAVLRRRSLQRAVAGVLDGAGYQELIPPTFEYETVFLTAAGPGVLDRLIRFLDLDGRGLALRYDFTASIARVAATTYRDAAPPLRFSYSGKVFRQEPERGARPRETLQAGAELLGSADVAADREILALTIAALRAAGVQDFQLNVGHAGVLADGLGALTPTMRETVHGLIDRKDRAGLERALRQAPPAAAPLLELAFVIGQRTQLDHARGRASGQALRALDSLLALDDALDAATRAHVVFDLGEVRGLGYYTGMHFEVFVAGAGRAAGAGGRYDDLMGRFGRDMPAVGMSLDLDVLADLG